MTASPPSCPKHCGSRPTGGCNSPTVYSHELDRILTRVFALVTEEQSAAVQEYIDTLRAFAARQDSGLALAQVEQEMAALGKRKDKLLDLVLAGALSNEEFKQRNLNQPYGDASHLLRELAYESHPYRWPTIGKEIAHIAQATLEEVKDFFYRFYAPNNAILAVTGHISFEETIRLAEKWFGPIPARNISPRQLPAEKPQTAVRRKTVERKVPVDAIYMAFHMSNRMHPDYYVYDMITDILSNGRSSRFIQSLVQEQKLFTSIDAYISGSLDEGLLHVTGKPVEGASLEQAEEAIWKELEKMKTVPVSEQELEKVKNRYESEQIFNNINYLNVATNLAFFELTGKAEDINEEVGKYRAVTAEQIQTTSTRCFVPENCSILYYKAIS